jgi:hypothetical protein
MLKICIYFTCCHVAHDWGQSTRKTAKCYHPQIDHIEYTIATTCFIATLGYDHVFRASFHTTTKTSMFIANIKRMSETIGNHTKQSTFFVANVQFLQRLEFSNVIISFW